MAFATSEASARVGRGFSIMLSSIWVAVITTRTGLFAALAMIRFCAIRHVLGAELDAQVAAGDHHAVRGREDRLQVVERLGLLDLRDQ